MTDLHRRASETVRINEMRHEAFILKHSLFQNAHVFSNADVVTSQLGSGQICMAAILAAESCNEVSSTTYQQ